MVKLGASPHFLVHADCISTLQTPAEFYESLLTAVQNSRRQLTLASLYVGTGDKEKDLIQAIRRRLQEQPDLRVNGQFDYSRTLRRLRPHPSDAEPLTSSADLLLQLYQPLPGLPADATLPQRVRVGLTRLPAVRGWVGSFLPDRFIEAVGVWHVKAYVADGHTILLTGANLSTDYFTNRQDRYILIQSKQARDGGEKEGDEDGVSAFAAYLHGLVDKVGSLPGSHVLIPVPRHGQGGKGELLGAVSHVLEDGSVSPPVSAEQEGLDQATCASRGSKVYFRGIPAAQQQQLDEQYLHSLKTVLPSLSSPPDGSSLDPSLIPSSMCAVTPRIQCALAGVRHDEAHTLQVIHAAPQAEEGDLHVATGYFNVTNDIMAGLVGPSGSSSCVHVLTASPEANGFLGASGPAGAIPLAYSEMEREFLEAAAGNGRLMQDPVHQPRAPGVAVHEYGRTGWTFHAKGMWLHTRPSQGKEQGMVSLVGSPNYGVRSVERDLELQMCMVTRNPGLVARMVTERDRLFGRWSVPHHSPGSKMGPAAEQPTAHVRPIGAHLGPVHDVFNHPGRAIGGWTWDKGWWIHVGRRVLARFF